MASTGELWFRVTVAIVSFIIVVTSIVNLIYYSNASSGNCQGISTGFATFMLWLNVVILIVAVAMFFWAMVVIFTTKKDRQDAYANVKASIKDSDTYKALRSKDTSTSGAGSGVSQTQEETAAKLKELEARTGRTATREAVVSGVASFS